MARPIRIQYPGAFYHIMSRGSDRLNIFNDSLDYQDFLLVFFDTIKRYNWTCYAYCLMPNHYHLLIKTNEANLSLGMRQLNGVYTQNYNIRYKRIGHLFQGRFKSILVEEERYKYELIRYIALNPLRANTSQKIEDYKWNSVLEVLGLVDKTGCINTKEILSDFDEDEEKARNILLEFLGAKYEKDIEKPKGGIILGSNEFIKNIKNYFKEKNKEIEIPKRERLAFRPSLKELFKGSIINKQERNNLIYKANLEFGYSLAEISKELGLHYSSIGKVIRKKLKKSRFQT
jgi:REP element-mobilizing transposase RayT